MQIFGSIGSVGGGLALGKEGPLVHTGACIASLFGQVRVCCWNDLSCRIMPFIHLKMRSFVVIKSFD